MESIRRLSTESREVEFLCGSAPWRDYKSVEVFASSSQVFIISIKNRHGSSGSIFSKKWRGELILQ
jgi:hypothetical protein